MLQALSGTICPDTVLLFEFRIDILLYESLNIEYYLIVRPAAELAERQRGKIFKINRFFCKFALKIYQNFEKSIFSLFSIFSKNFAVTYPNFHPEHNLQRISGPSSDSPSQKVIPENKIKSKFERMELSQKLTFLRKNSKYVASRLRDDLP